MSTLAERRKTGDILSIFKFIKRYERIKRFVGVCNRDNKKLQLQIEGKWNQRDVRQIFFAVWLTTGMI